MDNDAPGGVNFFLSNALWHWLFLFFLSAAGALVSHGLFGLPLIGAVDVILSLQLMFVALWLLAICLTFLEIILIRRNVYALIKSLVALIVCALLPFSSVAGFGTYALVTGGDIAGASFVYVPMVRTYLQALLNLGLIPDHLQDPTVLGLVPVDVSPGERSAATGVIQIYLILASIVLSTLATFAFRIRKKSHSMAWPNT